MFVCLSKQKRYLSEKLKQLFFVDISGRKIKLKSVPQRDDFHLSEFMLLLRRRRHSYGWCHVVVVSLRLSVGQAAASRRSGTLWQIRDNVISVHFLFLRPTISLLCSLFKVRRLVIGCINQVLSVHFFCFYLRPSAFFAVYLRSDDMSLGVSIMT